MSTFAEETRTARKGHVCAYCRMAIDPGEKYETWVCKDGSSVFRCNAHRFCIGFYAKHTYASEEIFTDCFWDAMLDWRREVEDELGVATHTLDDSGPREKCYCRRCLP